MERVGLGLRTVATIIDTALLFVVGYVMAVFTGSTTDGGFRLTGGPAFVWLLVALAYYIVLEAQSGATLGKRLVGIKVVRLEGDAPIDMQASIVRNVLRLVDGLFFYLVAAIAVIASKDKQRLGDMVAKTVVVRNRTAS
jgi:uncharacterized RDD family membrane protein YckC